jgi:sarcosine oxidase subunit alpha
LGEIVDRRVYEHPILRFERGRRVKILFEGREIPAFESETIAAALYAAGVIQFNYSSKLMRPRGPFCMIGKCSQCMMKVDGVPHVRTCITPVRDGMTVEREAGHEVELPEPKHSLSVERVSLNYDVVVVGAGPAGLKAALEASEAGARVAVLDQSPVAGGQLSKQTHKFFGTRESYAGMRGVDIARMLVSMVKERENIDLFLRTQVIGYFKDAGVLTAYQSEGLGKYKVLTLKAKSYVIASGAMERNLVFPGDDLPGVMGAGAAQTLMNIFGIRPADKPLIIGAGNVGVIVAYQAVQAGVDIQAVIDIAPKSAAYLVHSSKIRRMGIPILMRTTIKEAYGKGKVEGAVLYEVDKNFKPIPGSEKDVEVDGIWLAVGLSPSVELLELMGASLKLVPELGGYVPLRTQFMETTIPSVFIAGDVSSIEEASTAMMEGVVAGVSAAEKAGFRKDELARERSKALKWLDTFRSGPHYRRIKEGLTKVLIS